MSLQDPIADMLTRIRNAQQAKHKSVSMASSKIKLAIARVLKEEGFIIDFEEIGENKKSLTIALKYFNGKGAILSIDRTSRPGLRQYQKAKSLSRVLGGLGLAIISTSKGVMSADNARANNLGGEILCCVT